MQKLAGILFSILFVNSLQAQKPPLDTAVFRKWDYTYGEKISPDGKFFTCEVSIHSERTLRVQSTGNHWQRDFVHGENAMITADGRRVIFTVPGDSLGIFTPVTNNLVWLTGITSYKTSAKGNGRWLAGRKKDNVKDLLLVDLINNKSNTYSGVEQFYFSDQGKVLLLQTGRSVQWIDLPARSSKTICSNIDKLVTAAFNDTETKLALGVEVAQDSVKRTSIRYYSAGMDSAVTRISEQSPGMEGMTLFLTWQTPFFSPNGTSLYFRVKPLKPAAEPNATAHKAKVDIWHYRDPMLQSQQQNMFPHEKDRSFTAVIHEGDDKVVRLNNESDDYDNLLLGDHGNAGYAFVATKGNVWEYEWNESARPDFYLVSTKDGSRKLIKKNVYANFEQHFSPKGRFVLWYDRLEQAFFSYNVATGMTVCISNQLPKEILADQLDVPGAPSTFGMAAWLANDDGVLVYDQYDVWLLDPAGDKPPQNITHGYGRKHRIMFRCELPNVYPDIPVVKKNERLLLAAFDAENKNSGYFMQPMGHTGDPELLTMGPYLYDYMLPNYAEINQAHPIKARNADMYLLKRSRADEFPNLYSSGNFKTLVQLTQLAPQKKYNWMTSELKHWTLPNGARGEGILYKPENFDSTKKYPVIFYFYEKDADALHRYISPGWSDGRMNIAWYVSNGYLVFDPNIYYKTGAPMQGAYDAVVSAAKYLCTFPWVDKTCMGLQGHSFGGFEVNFLITQTNIFRCAMSAAGLSDMVSMYGTLRDAFGVTSHWISESGQTRMGAPLWEVPEAYIRNSPVFFAHKVTTPLLMMANKKDGAVPWSQSVEFFTALRRLGKKAWMLQYDNGGHQVDGDNETKDYTIRMQQFFDHYLKGAPAPVWMTRGIPFVNKGLEDGLQYDNKITTP